MECGGFASHTLPQECVLVAGRVEVRRVVIGRVEVRKVVTERTVIGKVVEQGAEYYVTG